MPSRAVAALAAAGDRDARREMKLQGALAASLAFTRGPTVIEVGAAWTKALEIAESLDDAEYRLRSLWALWSFYSSIGQHQVARALAERFCALAAEQPDSPERLVGERMIGVSHYYLGDQRSARRHLERVLASYVPPDHKSHTIRFQLDQRVMAQAFLARVLWLQGFPDRAMRSAESGIEDARATNHAVSVCHVLDLAGCTIALWAGDLAAAEHYGAMLLDYSGRHSLARWREWGHLFENMLVIKHGNLSTGLPLLRATLEEVGEASSAQADMTYRGAMAEALGRAGQIADGFAEIEAAIERSEQAEERWIIAELLRIRGELWLLQGGPDAGAAAEDHFRQALDWARRQGALSWELRAAMSLARLRRDQGLPCDAVALLQPVYDRFTEGFGTADLIAAKQLLDEMSDVRRG